MLAFAMMVAGTAEAQNSAIHYVGGDISLLTKYETQKAQYKDLNGKTISALLPYLKEQGWNTIRVRLMVDPSKSDDPKSVIQDLDYVKALGARIKAAEIGRASCRERV